MVLLVVRLLRGPCFDPFFVASSYMRQRNISVARGSNSFFLWSTDICARHFLVFASLYPRISIFFLRKLSGWQVVASHATNILQETSKKQAAERHQTHCRSYNGLRANGAWRHGCVIHRIVQALDNHNLYISHCVDACLGISEQRLEFLEWTAHLYLYRHLYAC